MSKRNKLIYFILTIIFLIIFDVYFSNLIIENVRFYALENSLIDLVFVQNTGAAFNILENSTSFLIIFSVLAICLIFVNLIKNIKRISTIACFWCAMMLAGIFCNLYERICFGYVRDYFKLNFIDFPIFNISDVFINIGVFAIIVIIIKNNYLKKI